MTAEVWIAIGGTALFVVYWIGQFFAWFSSKHGRGVTDGSAPTMQGSQTAPPDLGGHGGGHAG
ncbi:hypothetical protein [Curtobacterium sp. TXMA1]|uniref:hypothetical protein n=1 Tax=Curtobacterium sp. TXMA1 TaxID=2876939 RepID=UPI001CCE9C7B|nr:hypothetical protein [Curtobacterium sp. TXMA1]UBQ03987.1 hypothetical protein LCG91_07520 [Curtobacterium sp. TXMA1]